MSKLSGPIQTASLFEAQAYKSNTSIDSERSNIINTRFTLWYQPVYNTKNGNVLHHEVLLRWLDKQGRVCMPSEFLPKVYHARMLGWLDYLVIRKAISLLSKQPNQCFSINLSKQAYVNTSIVEYILDLLATSQVKPQQLNFELSEKNVADNFSNAIILIRKLKALGCSVTLDGFNSSLLTFSQWEKLPFDLVKIDGRLIENLITNDSNQKLVRSIVEMSQMTGQVSIAKGFSSNVNPKLLQEFSISCGQGYGLKPPSAFISSTPLVNVLDIFVDNISRIDLLKDLKEGVVFTPNVDHLMKLKDDQEFLKTYSAANYKVCDSQILLYASKFLGTPIKEKISGSDFFPAFCSYHKFNRDVKIFLLGGPDQRVANKARLNLNQKAGREIVIDAYSPPFGFEHNEAENMRIVEMINESSATVLAVGVGAPKQEKWIVQYRHQLPNIRIFLAIGATINFEAGSVQRAPNWMSSLGMEWLYRLFAEPKRLWKRYLVDDLPFLGLILQQKLYLMEQRSNLVSTKRRSDRVSLKRIEHQPSAARTPKAVAVLKLKQPALTLREQS